VGVGRGEPVAIEAGLPGAREPNEDHELDHDSG
jgi:hypothetical protein